MMIESADKIKQEIRNSQHKIWIKYSWGCLRKNFLHRNEFNSLVNSLGSESKNKFIWLSAFWYIMGDKPNVSYKQTQKLIVSFSVIEALYEDSEYQDFFNWLNVKQLKEKTLEELKKEWRNIYGSSEKMRVFLRENLNERQRQALFSHFKVKRGKDKEFRKIKDLDEFSECLIIIRNSFIHKAKVVDVFLNQKSLASSAISKISKDYTFHTAINFEFIEDLFKSGFIEYFKTHK